jgi:DNA-binding NarL/FixJ family response regulator
MIRVLIADDQSMVRAGFRLLLAGEDGIDVVAEARNGLEAVHAAARFDPTVILMDIRMPELDGLEATRRILARDEHARVLILTTFDLDEYVYEALRAGASGFVLKDDPPEQLIAAVRTVAAGDALLSPSVTKRVIRQFTRVPRPSVPAAYEELPGREREIFRLIAAGLSNAEIGEQLFIGETTVKTHVTHIFQKLGLRDRVQAVVLAFQTGLFDARATQASNRSTFQTSTPCARSVRRRSSVTSTSQRARAVSAIIASATWRRPSATASPRVGTTSRGTVQNCLRRRGSATAATCASWIGVVNSASRCSRTACATAAKASGSSTSRSKTIVSIIARSIGSCLRT